MAFGPLVETDWLRKHLRDGGVRVIDFRWYLQGRNGRDEYERGHLPGAVFVDLEDVTGREGAGRHPLPTPSQFEHEMRRAGVDPNTKVVAYDDAGGSVAASLVPFFTGSAGSVYLAGAIVLGVGLVGISLLDLEGRRWTRRLWTYSMVYVALLFAVFAVSPFLP